MAGPYYIGDSPTLSRDIVDAQPYRVQAIITYPDGTETVYDCTIGTSSVYFVLPTLTQANWHSLKWNLYYEYDNQTFESFRERFKVHPSAFTTPFVEPRIVMTSNVAWKHTGWGQNHNYVTLPRLPKVNDVVVQWVWNKASGSTTIIGDGSWTRKWDNNTGVCDEIWWKRWTALDTARTWENVNSNGYFVSWAAVIRGCVATGDPIDVASATEGASAAPTVTTTGTNRYVLRSFFGTVPGFTLPVPRHVNASDGRIWRVGYAYLNKTVSAGIVSLTKSVKATAGATGTATIGSQGTINSTGWYSTVALIDA